MEIRALLWSLPFLLHKALGWNEYVIPQHSAFHFCPLTMAFYRVIGCMFILPMRSWLCMTNASMHIEFAVNKERHCTSPSAAINFLYSGASPTIRYYEILYISSLDVFLLASYQNEQEIPRHTFHACATPTIPKNYKRECKCIVLRLRPAISKYFGRSPWSFIRRFIARVLGAFHTNPLTGTRISEHMIPKRLHIAVWADVQSPVVLSLVDAWSSALYITRGHATIDRPEGIPRIFRSPL